MPNESKERSQNFYQPFGAWLKDWLISFAGFGFVAFIISAQFLATEKSSVEFAFRSALRDFLPWAILTPLLFRLTERYPLGRRLLFSRIILHLVSCLAVLVLCHWWMEIITPGFQSFVGGPPPDQFERPPPFEEGPPPHRERPGPHSGPIDLVRVGTFQLPLYLMIMSAAHAALFYRRDREREASLAKARLDVLTTQLQPHFLFNTLNTIAELVHEDANKADAMITALSEMLRLTLDGNAAELVPLQKEAQFIERYFAIMQMRFGARLQYECAISSAARSALVPPFLLQPLVENAIRHGIEPKTGGGTVTISAEVNAGVLQVAVHDNGVGLPDAKPKREGLGLTNTRERLRQLFGDQSSVTLRNGDGVTVEVALPFTAG